MAFEIVEGEPVICQYNIQSNLLVSLLISFVDPTDPFDPEHFVDSDEFKGLQNNQVVFEFDKATWKASITLASYFFTYLSIYGSAPLRFLTSPRRLSLKGLKWS